MEINNVFKNLKRLTRDGQSPDDYLTNIFGEPYIQYRKKWEAAGENNIGISDFPLQLDFQLNNRCNYRCIMCYWSNPSKVPDWQEPATDFPYYKFCEIVSEGVKHNFLKAINFEGLNEPLLKKDLPKYIKFANRLGVMDLTLHTNGLLLNHQWSERLIISGLTRLMVSLDAFTEETYLRVRRSNKYKQVIKNIATFLKVRSKMNSKLPLLRVSFIHQPANIHEACDFKEFWSKYADYILMQELFDITNLLPGNQFNENNNNSGAFKFCKQPFYRMSIKANGDAFPCCCSLGHIYLVNGNVYKDDIPTLWKSNAFEKIRKLHKNGKYYKIPACKICLDNIFY